MGNELITKENEKNIVNNNDVYFKRESNENILKIKYKIISPGEKIRLIGHKFYEKNNDKCKMIIDFTLSNLLEFYTSNHRESSIIVTLSLNNKIIDLSYIFYECTSLVSISDLNYLNLNKVTNISYMFYGCSSLNHYQVFLIGKQIK